MAKEVYTFDEAGMRRVIEAVRASERRIVTLENKLANISVRRHEFGGEPGIGYAAKTGVSGIPAATGTSTRIAGSGTVTLYRIEPDGTLVETDFTKTVYNMAMEAVGNSVFIQVKKDTLSHRLLVDWEECA